MGADCDIDLDLNLDLDNFIHPFGRFPQGNWSSMSHTALLHIEDQERRDTKVPDTHNDRKPNTIYHT